MKSSKKRKAALLSNLFKANAVKKDIDKVRAAIPLRVPTSLKKKGRKRKRKRPDSENKHPLAFHRKRQRERDRKKRAEQIDQTQVKRTKHILELRNKLYGPLSFQQLKPHIVLEFFEFFDKIADEENKYTRSYEAVSKKFSVSSKTVSNLVKQYESTTVFKQSQRGIHPKAIWALHNEEARELFVQKVRDLRERDKGTAKWFLPTDKLLVWVNSELLSEKVREKGTDFGMRSLQLWLHRCGFVHGEIGKKGVYFDGHERDDVKKRRKEYIQSQKMKHTQYVRFDESKLDDPSYWKSNPQPFWNPRRGATGLDALPILKVSHDESIYRLYSYVNKQWFEEGRQAILPKGEGQGLHVSDFITTFGPVKKVDGSPVRDLMGPIGKGRYWNNDLFLLQVEEAVRGLSKHYPNFRYDFKFDNAPLHKKRPDDALVLAKMNRKPGGKQPKMRETCWTHNGESKIQSLTFRRKRRIDGVLFLTGEPKGLLQIAKERVEAGAIIRNVEHMKKDDLVKALSKFADFKSVKSKLAELISKLNCELFHKEQRTTFEFLPKYHCELSEIEMWWRNSKYTFRRENDRQWCTIEKRVERALEQFAVPYYASLFRQVKAIEMAYGDGMETNELLKLKQSNFPSLLEKLAKRRKHHRGPLQIQKEKDWGFINVGEIHPRVTVTVPAYKNQKK